MLALKRGNSTKAIVDNFTKGRKTGGDACPGGKVTTHVVSYCRHPTGGNNNAAYQVSKPRIIKDDGEWLQFLSKITLGKQTWFVNMSGEDAPTGTNKKVINSPLTTDQRNDLAMERNSDRGSRLIRSGARRGPGTMVVNGIQNAFINGRPRRAGYGNFQVGTVVKFADIGATKKDGISFFKGRGGKHKKARGIEIFTTRKKKGGFKSWGNTNQSAGYSPSSGRNSIGRTKYERI